MHNLCLVTGANGHLGNNLVRALTQRGERVRAGVRDVSNAAPFRGVECERVYAELQDRDALRKALKGVDVLYQVAAVFKHWAKNPDVEIVRPNVNGTRTILEVAAEAGVHKVVYVSSVAAIGHGGLPLDESHWNDNIANPYYRSKILSERLAWETAGRLGLSMVSVLPSAMIGPHAQALTDTMEFIEQIRLRRLPINPSFFFNFVDVRDVATGAIAAATQGRAGERYVLANTHSSGLEEIMAAANAVNPGYRLPPRAPRWLMMSAAWGEEQLARITGKRAQVLRSQVRMFYGCRQEYRIDKAQRELNYCPRPPEQALREVFSYLKQRQATGAATTGAIEYPVAPHRT